MRHYKDPPTLFLALAASLLTLGGCAEPGVYVHPLHRNQISQPARPVQYQYASRYRSDRPSRPPSQPPSLSRSQPEDPNAMARTSMEGCLAVGAIAALGANLLSNNGHRRRNTAIAGLLGCGAGVAANAYVQGQRRQYASSEDRLQAEIAEMRAENRRVAALIATTRQTISADLRHLASLNAAYHTRQVSMADARARMRKIETNRSHLQQTLASLEGKEEDWRALAAGNRRSGSDTREMDREIQRLQGQISSLERDLELLDQQIRVSPVSG
jgi:hypothetical protein